MPSSQGGGATAVRGQIQQPQKRAANNLREEEEDLSSSTFNPMESLKQNNSMRGNMNDTKGNKSFKEWENPSGDAQAPDVGRSNSGNYAPGPKNRTSAGSTKKGYAFFGTETEGTATQGFDFADFKRKSLNGELDMDDLLGDILKMGGRDALIEKFRMQMNQDPDAYCRELDNMKQMSKNDPETKKLKKIYSKDGKFALQLELEDQFDNMDRKLQAKMLQIEGSNEIKGMLKNGDIDGANREHKKTWVQDKMMSFMSLHDPKEFKMMKMLAGQNIKDLKIPQGAIINKDKDEEQKKGWGFGWGKKVDTKEENRKKEKIQRLETSLRNAAMRDDLEKMSQIVAELKILKGGLGYADANTKKDSESPMGQSAQAFAKGQGKKQQNQQQNNMNQSQQSQKSNNKNQDMNQSQQSQKGNNKNQGNQKGAKQNENNSARSKGSKGSQKGQQKGQQQGQQQFNPSARSSQSNQESQNSNQKGKGKGQGQQQQQQKKSGGWMSWNS